MDGGAWQATVHGIAKSQTMTGDWAHVHARQEGYLDIFPTLICRILAFKDQEAYRRGCGRLLVSRK